MDFPALLRQHHLLDILTVGDIHYALSTTSQTVAGCTTILISQLHSYLPLFLRSGYSQRYQQPYSSLLGMQTWLLYSYSLEELPATKKQTFSHALAGTGGRKGLLATWHGEKIGRSAFFAPVHAEKDVHAFFSHWHIDFKVEVVLRGE